MVADGELWQQWVSWFERHWSRLHGMISLLPGQPTDEFLEVAKRVAREGLSGRRRTALGATDGRHVEQAAGRGRSSGGLGGVRLSSSILVVDGSAEEIFVSRV